MWETFLRETICYTQHARTNLKQISDVSETIVINARLSKGSITLGTIKKVSLLQNIKIERIRSNRFVLLQSFLSEQLLTTIRWGLILLNRWFFFLWQMLNKINKRIGKKNSRVQKPNNNKSRRGETRKALGKENRILGFSKNRLRSTISVSFFSRLPSTFDSVV